MTPPPRALRLADGAPVLHYGPRDGPQLLVLQPLFEEMNRSRALVAALCRELAARGVGTWLPDLPGTGEDARALRDVAWTDWLAMVAEARARIANETGCAVASLAIRGGALLDAGLARRWRLAPVAGASLLRDLERAGLTGEAMAGYDPSTSLRSALAGATPSETPETRTLRMSGDDRAADLHVDGPQLWRRAEPAGDQALATRLTDDVALWIGRQAERTPSPSPTPPAFRRDEPGRRILRLALSEEWIAATIDGPATATRGWLFVTGGSQTRVGPNRLYERLAATLAERGDAVIRFDRRGVGDSPGIDGGYRAQRDEIAAAAAALRAACPGLATLSGFGLCDGATALALDGGPAGIDRLVAANPWVVEPIGDEPPAAAVRAHYRDRLRDAAAWSKLLRGGVDLSGLVRSLRHGARRDATGLAAAFADGVPEGSTIVLADGDNTARAFVNAWGRLPRRPSADMIAVATRSHGFAGTEARAVLADALTRRR